MIHPAVIHRWDVHFMGLSGLVVNSGGRGGRAPSASGPVWCGCSGFCA